ncbi:hypothetical protein [Methylobacter sp.]|uniref:hypothetical protein n=1 Tax=Methylobacter sp. TaxID=2051955 RepID=UPI003DA627E1
MLWILSSDVTEIDFSQDANSCAALENILSAVFCGYHVLKLTNADINKLREQSSNFSGRSKAVILALSSQRFQKLPDIKYKATISKSCKAPIKKTNFEWEIPFDSFSSHAAANKTTILAEDYIDAALYNFAAKHYVTKNKLKGFEVSSRSEAGGGSRIKSVLETIVSRKEEICICVTDSDKYSPSASMSVTARDCSNIVSKSKWPVAHIATHARELENILPRKFINEVVDSHQQNEWQSIENVAKKFSPLLPYIDIKEGTCMHWVLGLPKGSPCRTFWNKELQSAAIKSPCNHDCLDSQTCEVGDSDKCNCVISQGVGTRIAEKVLDYLQKQSVAKSSEQVDKDLNQEWLSIGKEVFEWCCAAKPIRC